MRFIGRPWCQFDAKDPQHREWYAAFLRTRSWGTCPVRWIHPREGIDGNLPGLMQRDLIRHYLSCEFGTDTLGEDLTDYRDPANI